MAPKLTGGQKNPTCEPEIKTWIQRSKENESLGPIYLFLLVLFCFGSYKWKISFCCMLWILKLMSDAWVNIILHKENKLKTTKQIFVNKYSTTVPPMKFLSNEPGLGAANSSWKVWFTHW